MNLKETKKSYKKVALFSSDPVRIQMQTLRSASRHPPQADRLGLKPIHPQPDG
jgi:hypothetical protein